MVLVGYTFIYNIIQRLTVICLMVTACCFVLAPPSIAMPSFLLTLLTGMVRISPCRWLKPANDLPMSGCAGAAAWRREGRSDEACAMKTSRPATDRFIYSILTWIYIHDSMIMIMYTYIFIYMYIHVYTKCFL